MVSRGPGLRMSESDSQCSRRRDQKYIFVTVKESFTIIQEKHVDLTTLKSSRVEKPNDVCVTTG